VHQDGVDTSQEELAQTLLRSDASTSEDAMEESSRPANDQTQVVLQQRLELELLLIPPEVGS
jgi:hypothetical protein